MPQAKGPVLTPGVIKLSESDVALERQTFCDNEALLKTMRALFFGLGVTEQEKELVRNTFANADLLRIVRNRFLPALSKEMPIGQVQDAWLAAQEMVFGQTPENIEQAVVMQKLSMEMVDHALGLLSDPDGTPVSLEVRISTVVDPLATSLLARNRFIKHVESQLALIWIATNQKVETPKDAAKRAAQDSTR